MAPLNRGIRKKVFIHAYHVRQLVHPTMSNFAQQAQNQASQLGQSAQNQASQLGQSAQHQAGNAGEGTSSLSPTVCLTIRSSALRRPGQAGSERRRQGRWPWRAGPALRRPGQAVARLPEVMHYCIQYVQLPIYILQGDMREWKERTDESHKPSSVKRIGEPSLMTRWPMRHTRQAHEIT